MKTSTLSIAPLRFLPALRRVGEVVRLLCLFGAIPGFTLLRAADDKIIAAVRAADDARLAATKAADRAALDAVYSDDLHYVHSSGKVDNKTSQIQGIVTGGNQ